MKNITKIITLMVIISMMTFGLQSCKKYEDGPLISLTSRTSRVANNWKVDNYKLNGTDFTSLMTDYKETYTTDHNYSYTWGLLGGTGTWAFSNNDADVQITGTDNQASYTLVILKLEENAFWYYYMDGNDKKEFHMIPQ